MAALPKRWLQSATTPARQPADEVAGLLRTLPAAAPQIALRTLIDAGLDRLPEPGRGATLARWQALETVARTDLALVKLYEGHTDALAILAEIDAGHPRRTGYAYGVWASEARADPLVLRSTKAGPRVDGRKSWCSGAASIDVALVTAVDAAGRRRLVELDLDEDGVRIELDRWQAIGMRDSGSVDIVCNDVPVRVVGDVDAYLSRPGFWHGGGGIAACWFGGAAAVATGVRDLQRGRDDVHALAHLGAIDGILAQAGALLRECAEAIDRAPGDDAMRIVLRLRGAVADGAIRVLDLAARAIGPGPLCNDSHLARLFADLPVFVRQSRAEHDLVAQARALLADDSAMGADGWTL